MREVVIVKWCDGVIHKGVNQTPATEEHIVSLDGQNLVQIDLCDSCDEIISELSEVLVSGVPVGKATKGKVNRISTSAPKSFHCPLCDYTARSDSGVKQHLKKFHDTTASALAAEEPKGEDVILPDGP